MTEEFIQQNQTESLGSKILITESNRQKKYTEKFILKNQIISILIPIETVSILERSNVKASNNSSETKMNKKVSDYHFKKIIYNKNINNYKNETDQNNNKSDVVSSNNKNTNINSINISLWNCRSFTYEKKSFIN